MATDRINTLPNILKLRPEDLVPGRSFTTLRKGHEPEQVVFEGTGMGKDRRGRDRFEVRLVNPDTNKPVNASYDRFINGRVGMSRVIVAEPILAEPIVRESERSDQITERFGSDMVVVTSKGGIGEEIFTVVSKVEDGLVILESPEKPGKQILRIPEEDLRTGESDSFYLRTIDPKFSLLKDAVRLEKEVLERKDPPLSYVREVRGYGQRLIPSRDIAAAEVAGGLLPARTIDEILKSPEGVLIEAIDAAARRMIELARGGDGVAQGLAWLFALKEGNLVNLSFRKNSVIG